MDKKVISLYQQMNANACKNREDAQYWIYQVDSEIKRINGLSKRFIKVLFFNRYFNENDNLMRLNLLVNGKEVQQDQFSVVSQYRDPNVLGFLLEVDLAEENKEVEILSYIQDGKTVLLSGNYVPPFDVVEDEEKLRILQLYQYPNGEKEIHAIPVIEEDHWICLCGNYNSAKDVYCKVCATKIDEAKRIASSDHKSLILNNINTVIKPDQNETMEETIERYVNAFHNKYGYEKEEIRSHIDAEKIRQHAQTAVSTVAPASTAAPLSQDGAATGSSNKLPWIIGIAVGVIILIMILSSSMTSYNKQKCYESGGLWINGGCEMFNDWS